MNQRTQGAIMLSIMSATFHFLHSRKFFARVDIAKTCKNGLLTTIDIIARWPDRKAKDWEDTPKLIKQ